MTTRRWGAKGTGLLVAAMLAASCGGPPAGGVEPADLLITNGRVFTADAGGTIAQAVAVRGTQVVAVGTAADLEVFRGPATRVLDAGGGTVAPGFNDAHVHFLSGGFALSQVDLAGLTTLDAVQAAIRDFAAAHPGDGWLQGRGWLYAPFPGASPTREQLDAVIGDRPAVMSCYDGHSIWVNTPALEAAGITRDTPDPPNGVIVRDPTGRPTGHLKEAAADLVTRVMPRRTDAERRDALEAAVAHATRLGITSIQNAGGAEQELPLYEAALRAGTLRVRAYLAFSADGETAEADVDRWESMRQRIGRDNPTLTLGIVKIFADGVIESRTAAMIDPYEGTGERGAMNMEPEVLTRLVTLLDARGWQVQIHAIGDRAIRASLDAFEHAASVNPAPAAGRRHRLEHVEAIAAADIPRFAQLGIIASQQPMHVALGDVNQAVPAGPWPDNIGRDRTSRAWAWRRIQEAGGRLAFGSDWPVAPLEVGQGIWLAATRIQQAGGPPEVLPMADVLRGYTAWPAYASFEDHRKGVLAPGMLADIVILTADVMAAPPSTPDGVTVRATIFDGQVVYER